MEAIILAAGEGKRLRPLTNNTPKCLVNLFGKSLLQQQIETFRSCKIDDISVVTGHLNQMINFENTEEQNIQEIDVPKLDIQEIAIEESDIQEQKIFIISDEE